MTKKEEVKTFTEEENTAALDRLIEALWDASGNITRDAGTRFETLVKDFLSKDETYSRAFRKVYTYAEWVDKEKPDMARTDIGIDLVAKNAFNDDFTAIQCKFYSKNATITKSEVDSFIAASSAPCFTNRLIVTTCQKPWSVNVERELEGVEPAIQVIKRSDLNDCSFSWEEYNKGAFTQQKKFTPLPFQETAIEDVINGFKTNDRGKLIMACGTGKTFTSLKIAEKMVPEKGMVLFLVPSLSLLSQTLTSWTQQCRRRMTAFAVCSDNSTGKANLEEVESLTKRNELAYPATTNARALSEQVGYALAGDADMVVVFSTYHSIDTIHRAQKMEMPEFDLIVCDEAHRTASGREFDAEESPFTRVHDDLFIRGRKRLYMTATPRIYDQDSKSRDDVVLYSMDDEKIFGKTFHTVNFTKAIMLEKLVDYKVIVLGVPADVLGEEYTTNIAAMGGFPVEHASKVIGAWKALCKSGLQGEQSLGNDLSHMKRAVGFAQVIEEPEKHDRIASKTFTDQFGKVVDQYRKRVERLHGSRKTEEDRLQMDSLPSLKVETRHIDGSMCATEKDGLLNWLKEEPAKGTCKVLFNVRCLSEGVDVPSLDAVIFLSPRRSQVDVVQTVGRVMRTAPGKKRGYVIIPVVTTPDIGADIFMDNNKEFQTVWDTLNALKSIDENFGGVIDGTNQTMNAEKIEVICLADTIGKRNNGVGGGSKRPPKKVEGQGVLDLGRDVVLEEAIKARIIKRVGNRREWEEWAKDVGVICQQQIEQINKILDDESNAEMQKAFGAFSEELQSTLGGEMTREEIVEMLGQHIVTKPVLDALFEEFPFTENNPVARAMTDMVEKLDKEGMRKVTETLRFFYMSVKARAKTLKTTEQRQRVILELFDRFFKVAFPKQQDKLGIVYTPIEIVDFINQSVADVLKKEFGTSIDEPGVHVLDPFTGTGTFMTRLIGSGLIPVEKLPQKFKEDLHAHEIVPLAYYIASMNLEATYHEIMTKAGREVGYEPNNIVVWTDTFADRDEKTKLAQFRSTLKENQELLLKERQSDIRVIIGNPPYSVGQESQNDNNQNEHYELLGRRLEETYVAASKANLTKSIYDSYIKGYRWASDVLKEKGVIGFVTNAGWIESNSADGMRKCLKEEFSSIYVFHLKGNQRTSGEQSKKEGGKIFGEGSRAPIAIVLLVKNPEAKEQGKIYFHAVDDYMTREEKLAQVKDVSTYLNIPWKEIIPDEHNDWLNQRDDSFRKFIRMDGKKNSSGEKALFDMYSLGVLTTRDAWCFNSSKEMLSRNMSCCIGNYNAQVDNFSKGKEVDYDKRLLSWEVKQKRDVERGNKADAFSEKHVYESVYRPFFKQNFYFDKYWNARVAQMPKIFPDRKSENLIITINKNFNSGSGNVALMCSNIVDLHVNGDAQCFPRWVYEEADSSSLFADKRTRVDGISLEGMKHFRDIYGEDLSVDDVFYYIYGILHSEEYLTRYANNFSKELPRIPRVETRGEFNAFSLAGRRLADLHVNFEDVKEYDGVDFNRASRNYKVTQMKWGKIPGKTGNAGKDKTVLHYNKDIVIRNIPLEAQEYVVSSKSALDWIVDRVRVKTDKESGIKNDFNDYAKEIGKPRYPLSLVLKVITVSLETMKIVKSLPPLTIHPLDR